MDVSSALRRVKRSFGDEYAVVISDQDIFDWIYDAELDIIRHTSDNDISLQIPASNFPLNVPDRVNIKRLAVNNKALTYTTVSELDLSSASLSHSGTSSYWYFQGGVLGIWPIPTPQDKYIVEVTYSKTPTPMSVVAPYLRWVTNPAAIQYGLVPTDDDWKNKTSVNVAVDLALDSLNNETDIFCCGDGSAAGTFHFSVGFVPTAGNNRIQFYVGDGVTMPVHNLDFLAPIRLGERFKFRVIYVPLTATATLYRSDLNTGSDVLQSVSTLTAPFNKQVAAVAPLYIGNSTGVVAPPVAPAMRIYTIELRDSPDQSGATVFYFDGYSDLANLPGPMPNTTTSSGHQLQTFGGIIVNAYNEFVVPEVYHEDVVKYCLARAHTKNQNFRAAEAEMEQYDRRVSTRRNEAQAIEAPLYKIADPADYVDYY